MFLRRRQILVDRKIQFRYAFLTILFALVTALVTGSTVFFTIFNLLGEKLATVYPQGRLIPILQQAYFAFLMNILFILPVLFLASVVFSHRFAGPLPKIEEAIRRIGDGYFDVQLHTRKTDELVHLASVINETAKKLKQKYSSVST